MKILVYTVAIIAAIFSACSNNQGSEAGTKIDDTTKRNDETNTAPTPSTASVDEAVTAYLEVKNALTADNSKEAAAAGKGLHAAIEKLEMASFDPNQRKVYGEVKADLLEHAEHISTNADKMDHQREHFEMVSQDMYDLVKAVKPAQALYKTQCPMYNDKKGAFWLSEVAEIKNPYYGKKMLTCGSVKEEIK